VKKSKAILVQARTGPEGSRKLRLQDFSRHRKVVRFTNTVIPRLTSDPINEFLANEYFFTVLDSAKECGFG